MIIIYTRENCAYCPQVMKYLKNKGVPYRKEEAEGEQYTILSQQYGYTVPLVYNDESNDGMVGYNIQKLKEIAQI